MTREVSARGTLGCELAAEVLRSFAKLRLRVVGASMLPAVWPGDLLSVRSDDTAEAHPGDIVVFRREGRLVTHRVVERTICQEGIQWVTRGDRVGRNDAPISRRELLGRVTAIERASRRINPRLSFWSRIASAILSRSEFCTGLVLRLRGWGPGVRDLRFKVSAVPLQVEQAQLDTWIDIGRLIVEVGKAL